MCNKKISSQHLSSGYLLLEVTLAIAISALILGTVFKIVEWNLKVSNDAMANSNAHMKESAFFSFMDRAFTEMSGDTVVELNHSETTQHHLTELIFQDSGSIFSWPGQPFTPAAVKIVTKPNRDNTLDILLEYYEFPLINAPGVDEDLIDASQPPIQTLILLDDIARFEWQVWDGKTMKSKDEPQWEVDYTPNQGHLPPRFYQLNTIFETGTRSMIHQFWKPQKVNPSTQFPPI